MNGRKASVNGIAFLGIKQKNLSVGVRVGGTLTSTSTKLEGIRLSAEIIEQLLTHQLTLEYKDKTCKLDKIVKISRLD